MPMISYLRSSSRTSLSLRRRVLMATRNGVVEPPFLEVRDMGICCMHEASRGVRDVPFRLYL
jgi:hypothetical protein